MGTLQSFGLRIAYSVRCRFSWTRWGFLVETASGRSVDSHEDWLAKPKKKGEKCQRKKSIMFHRVPIEILCVDSFTSLIVLHCTSILAALQMGVGCLYSRALFMPLERKV